MKGRASRPSSGLSSCIDKLCRFTGALAQFFERAAQRLTIGLRFRLLADGQCQTVNGLGEALGEVDEDYQRIGVQLPDGTGIPRALEFLHLGGEARGYSDDAEQHSRSVRPRARLFEIVGGVGINLGGT